MAEQTTDHAQGLVYLALGGAGEIGMNLSLYGVDDEWLMVDLGIAFADESQPGIDVLVPDTAWIEARRDKLLALVLTHCHEDHLGAVAHVWPRLRCPVYASPYAAALLRRKLIEANLEDQIPVTIIGDSAPFDIGPFQLSMLGVTHSTMESKSLTIDTDYGRVVHSGDWKLDPSPLVGDVTDEAGLRAFGDRDVLAFVCDSTNVFSAGRSGSEADVRAGLEAVIKDRKGRVAVTTFASNVARIESVAVVAERLGRHLAVVGRSLWRTIEIARETGYADNLPAILEADDASFLPPDKVLYLCTGCQGEPRGAMARIAFGNHPHVVLEPGDLTVFSSKIIPGNERAIGRLHNALVDNGIEVITEKDALVHVSGHPCVDEMAEMYRWIRPRISVPVHGEARHLSRHAELARGWGVPQAAGIRNGDLLRLAPDGPARLGRVPVGRLAVDGGVLVPTAEPSLQVRRKLMYNGAAHVTLVLDANGRPVARPDVRLIGVIEGDRAGGLQSQLADELQRAIGALRRKAARSDEAVRETAAQLVRRQVRQVCGRRPLTEVAVVRLGSSGEMLEQPA